MNAGSNKTNKSNTSQEGSERNSIVAPFRSPPGGCGTKEFLLLFVALPHGIVGRPRSYMGIFLEDEPFDRLLSCARATGSTVLDLRDKLAGHPEWYWKNDWHFNAVGVEAVTSIAAPLFREALPGIFQ